MARPSKVDWDLLEIEFRQGKRSLRNIGEQFGISESAIRKKAKSAGWEQDLSARIDAKTEALVLKKEHREKVARGEAEDTDEGVVTSASEVRAEAVWQQRTDTSRARGVVNNLFLELEQMVGDNVDNLKKLGDRLCEPNENGIDKLNDTYQKVISLPGRADVAKKLVESLEKSINLERKILRIKDEESAEEIAKTAVTAAMSAAEAYKRFLEG